MSGRRKQVLCRIAVLCMIADSLPVSAAEVLELAGGFQPDPAVVAYEATGVAAAAVVVRGCPGYVDVEPALSATVTDASALLNVFLVGEGSAGVVVAGPDGIHHCDLVDQFGIAHIRFERVLSGDYMIWPIVATAGAIASGTLLVSEIEFGTRDVANFTGLEIDPALLPPLLSEQPLDPSAIPAFGRLMIQEGGPQSLTIALSGGVSAADAGPGCGGDIIQTRPDAILTLAGSEPQITISATSGIDTTLLVITPDGSTLCNDDAFNYNPALVISDAAAGNYAIWVGVYSGGDGQEAVLSAGRETPEGLAATGAAPTLDPSAGPVLGRHEFAREGVLNLALTLAGGVSDSDPVPGCSGAIDPSRPDATVTLDASEAALWFHATADDIDTTLVVVRPDGEVLCNDDYDGHNPAIGIMDAAPGDYAVWVGVYSGGRGEPALLSVGREEPALDQGPPVVDNPFAGRTIESAAQAFEILTEAFQLSEVMTFERLEQTGPEGLTLHGVVLRDTSGTEAPVEIGRVRLSDLDLAGLAANGAPERFSLAFEEIAYASLAESARLNDLPMPTLENPPPLSLEVSLLPIGGDMTRREMRLRLNLDEHVAVGIRAQMLWPEGAGAMGPDAVYDFKGEAIEIELHDMGFLRAVLREVALESGEAVEQVVAEGLGDLAGFFAPMEPGSSRTQLFDMVSARLKDLDRSGVMRIHVQAMAPMDIEALFGALAGDDIDASLVDVEIRYRPDP
jgi:hypothetical protein